MKAKEESNPRALKITQQYRARNGMTYELLGDGHRLTVHVCPRENATDGGDWRVDASAGPQKRVPSVSVWGSSRADAVMAAGRAWATHVASGEVPAFDWDAVAAALRTVRAI